MQSCVHRNDCNELRRLLSTIIIFSPLWMIWIRRIRGSNSNLQVLQTSAIISLISNAKYSSIMTAYKCIWDYLHLAVTIIASWFYQQGLAFHVFKIFLSAVANTYSHHFLFQTVRLQDELLSLNVLSGFKFFRSGLQ